MKRIRFIYGAMLLVLALAMNACDDYYSVAVAGDPGVTPVVLKIGRASCRERV